MWHDKPLQYNIKIWYDNIYKEKLDNMKWQTFYKKTLWYDIKHFTMEHYDVMSYEKLLQ